MPQDPVVEVDLDGLKEAAQGTLDYADQLKKQREATAATKQANEAEETQAKAELKDPRDAEEWGFKALAKKVNQFCQVVYKIPPLLLPPSQKEL